MPKRRYDLKAKQFQVIFPKGWSMHMFFRIDPSMHDGTLASRNVIHCARNHMLQKYIADQISSAERQYDESGLDRYRLETWCNPDVAYWVIDYMIEQWHVAVIELEPCEYCYGSGSIPAIGGEKDYGTEGCFKCNVTGTTGNQVPYNI